MLGLAGVALGASLGTWMLGMVPGITISLLLLIGLVSPSVYRAVCIYRRLDASPIDGIRMLILFVVYGLARFPLGKPL